MYFQVVDKQVLPTQGQPDGGVNLYRPTGAGCLLATDVGLSADFPGALTAGLEAAAGLAGLEAAAGLDAAGFAGADVLAAA